MENALHTVVSQCGNYVAIVTCDGTVHFWDTHTSQLLSRFSFHNHSKDLSLLCVNIRWLHGADTFVTDDERPSKRLKLENGFHATKVEKLAAIATTDGSIWVFNFLKQKLHSQIATDGANHGKLLNFDYESSSRTFFSVYEKSQLAQYSFDGKHLKTMELDKNDFKFAKHHNRPAIQAVDESTVLIGNNILSMIDWENEKVVQSFAGNNSRVNICDVITPIDRSKKHFLFMGTENDRMISVYDVKTPDRQYAYLALDDAPKHFQARIEADLRILAFVITASGKLLVFQDDLQQDFANKSPDMIIKPKMTFSVCVEPRVDFGFFCWMPSSTDHEPTMGSIVFGYGSANNPNFEVMTFKAMRKIYYDKKGVFKAKREMKLTVIADRKKNKKNDADKTQVLGPAVPNSMPETHFEKREFKLRKRKQMTIEMMLQIEELSKQHEDKDPDCDASRGRMNRGPDQLVTALEQGLKHDNKKMLDTALLCGNSRIIKNTVVAMKNQTVVPLIVKLQKRLQSNDGNQAAYFKWLTSLVENKLVFLLQLPDKRTLFQPLFKYCQFKQNSHFQLCLLRGKLNVMMNSLKELQKPVKEALMKYESESSDDEEEDDDDAEMSDDADDGDEAMHNGILNGNGAGDSDFSDDDRVSDADYGDDDSD